MNRPTVLITGAAGRLGSTVADLAAARGYHLLATDRIEPSDLDYPFALCDLRDHRAATEIVRGVDVVLHIGNRPAIGDTAPQTAFNENVSINENVFQAAAEQGTSTIVFASTIQLIGSHPDRRTVTEEPPPPKYPIDETTPPAPANVYALSKLVSETMLRYYAERCGLTGVALRLPLLHHHEPFFTVEAGAEDEAGRFEAFSGLSYADAARLFLAATEADLTGFHLFVAGTSHRHRDYRVGELIERFYPDVPTEVADLIDASAAADQIGWRAIDDYRTHHRTQPSPPEATS